MAPHNIRWGIMATGKIANVFVKDLLIDSALRNASDVSHSVVAVSSSSSKDRAEKFISDLRIPAPCTAYGSYKDLVADANVDVIYVATPHSHHFQNVMLALGAGKNVLCEKAFTVNAAQTKILCETAKKKNLFLMEAVWTRYLPVSIQVRDLIKKGEIGEVLRVIADTSFGDPVEEAWGTEHRMVKMDLAGGCLLDIGIYSLTWVFQALYHTLPRDQRKPPSAIAGHITPYHLTGADEATIVLVSFPTSTPSNSAPPRQSQAVAMTHLRVSTDPDQKGTAGPGVRIQGTKGEIQLWGHSFRPSGYHVIYHEQGKGVKEVECPIPAGGHGMFFEADEVARCLRDKKLESESMPWEESIVIMETMDEVRRQGGLVYPEKIESTVYPSEV